jgi:hypothetical protein
MSESDSEEDTKSIEYTSASDEESSSETKPSSKKTKEEESEGEDETAAIFEFMNHMKRLLKLDWIERKLGTRSEENNDTVEGIISESVNFIKNFDRIDYLNPELLAMASCFDIYYTKKIRPDEKSKAKVNENKVNEKNITEFVKMVDSKNAINIIRYIRLYQTNKIS